MVSFKDVSKQYGKRFAVQNLTFEMTKGEILGLLGQNGAGKSTTMNMLTGCLCPSHGTIKIGDFDILLNARQAKRKMGYLPEIAPLYDEMRVYAYLAFVAKLREVREKDIRRHVHDVAEKTGVQDVLDRPIMNLSKGYKQRVGLSQALLGNPEVLVLDEPTAGLDPKQTLEFRNLIQTLKGKHTILFSSHILSEVQQVADRVLILKEGSLIYDSDKNALNDDQVTLRVSIAMGAQKLLPFLRQLPCFIDIKVQKTHEEGITTVLLTAKKETQPERQLFTLLSAIQAPILRLSPLSDTLEDIFLRATQAEIH